MEKKHYIGIGIAVLVVAVVWFLIRKKATANNAAVPPKN